MSKLSLNINQIRFIHNNRLKMCGADIAKQIGISKSVVNNYMRKNGLQAPRDLMMKWKGDKMKGRSIVSEYADFFIGCCHLDIPVKTIACILNYGDGVIQRRVKQLGIVIPVDIIEQRKKAHQFQKGAISHNKGKKMAKDVYAKAKATMFKKGQLPHNTKYNGAESTRYHKLKDGRTIPYKLVRVANAKWRMAHVLLWEKKYGPLPEGMLIIFRNKDTMDIRLRNLQMISRQDHMKNNTIHRYPTDLKQLIRLNTKLKRKTNELRKASA